MPQGLPGWVLGARKCELKSGLELRTSRWTLLCTHADCNAWFCCPVCEDPSNSVISIWCNAEAPLQASTSEVQGLGPFWSGWAWAPATVGSRCSLCRLPSPWASRTCWTAPTGLSVHICTRDRGLDQCCHTACDGASAVEGA